MPYEIRQTPEFSDWHRSLADHIAQDAITARLLRFENGLWGDVKNIGDKAVEARVDVGPGYRLYYTRRGKTVIVVLCGGDKRQQQSDIDRAKAMIAEMDQEEEAAKPQRKGARKRGR